MAVDKELAEFIKNLRCQFEVHVQEPCDTKPFEDIDLPTIGVPEQIDWRDDKGELHIFVEKKLKKNKWHVASKDAPPEDRYILLSADGYEYPLVARYNPVINRWQVYYSAETIGSPFILRWRELPKKGKSK